VRILNDKERYEILSLKEDDITQKKLVELFAATNKGEAKYNTNDRFELTSSSFRKGAYHNKNTIITTIGKYIFNMFTLPESYLKKYGYNNDAMSGGNLSKQETNMTDMILIEELKPEDYLIYMRKGE
jgi:repressor of nif and glnA expression